MKPLSRQFAAIPAAMLFGAHAFAQSYPARPVRMVVPFAAGVLPHIRSGRLRALGVSGTARSATLPDVPTLTQAGVPFEFTGWLGVFAPDGSARDVVIRIQRDIAQAILAQDMHERLTAWGYEPVASP